MRSWSRENPEHVPLLVLLELKATDAMRPEWKRWLAFNNLEIPWAMGTDQLVTTRPIEVEVNSR